MKALKKIPLFIGILLAYILIIYVTFNAVTKVYKTDNPFYAKKVVISAFFIDLFIFAASGYLIYKLKVPTNKK